MFKPIFIEPSIIRVYNFYEDELFWNAKMSYFLKGFLTRILNSHKVLRNNFFIINCNLV